MSAVVLPWLLVAMASFGLLAGVYFFWLSLRYAAGTADMESFGAALISESRQDLEARKAALLREIRDLEFERDAGKLSAEDFQALDAQFRRDAKDVLRSIDGVADDHRQEAEALISEHIQRRSSIPDAASSRNEESGRQSAHSIVCPACTATNIGEDGSCQSCGARLAPIPCPKCEIINDADATFCKKCGAALVSEPEAVS